MTEEERLRAANEILNRSTRDLAAVPEIRDPVARRREIVSVARQLRTAANTLDQNGFLTE